METQSMLDALTDHLAIYHHSSSGTPPESSRARQAVVEWLASLSLEQRRAALTFVDTSWVAILLKMQNHLRKEGICTFFLLPDVPGIGRSNKNGVVGTAKSTRKSNGKGAPKGGRNGADSLSSLSSVKRDATNCALSLPDLCFRRARGLVRRSQTEIQQRSGNWLVNSIRLFSAEDGENATKLCNSGTSRSLNCVTITEDLIEDIETFLTVMDDISHKEFLKHPVLNVTSTWEESSWLKSMGYYSMPAYIANKFELELWSAWNKGTKKPPRSLGLKFRDSQNGNVAVGASLFGRKQNCMSWWRELQRQERSDLAKNALATTAKSEVRVPNFHLLFHTGHFEFCSR
jgi:hypothetical protein